MIEIVVLLCIERFAMKTDKLKYIFAFILLLCAFICGLNFKRWLDSVTTGQRVEKYIFIIYPFTPEDGGYGNFEELLQQEFRRQGIEPVFDRFYLNCNNLSTKDEIETMNRYLNVASGKQVDCIFTVGDQSAYALLSSHHRLLSSVPVVACNVRFPNEKLLDEYEDKQVYVLRDTPDYKHNLDFIKTLLRNQEMEIIYNIDLTYLGQQSFELLTRFIDRKHTQVIAFESAFIEQKQYLKLQDMIEYYNLKPAVGNHQFKKEKFTVSLCPFRYIKGTPMLLMMEKSKLDNEKQVFLLDKFDMVALPIVKALNIPSFSCIREGFGEDAKIVGGYMATEEISARSAADMAVALMNEENVGLPKIKELEKEYVLD